MLLLKNQILNVQKDFILYTNFDILVIIQWY